MVSSLKKYSTLSEALKDYTNASNPEQNATKILNHIKKLFPAATHIILFANIDLTSPEFGSWIVFPVCPGTAFENIEDFEGGVHIDASPKERFPVAYVELVRRDLFED